MGVFLQVFLFLACVGTASANCEVRPPQPDPTTVGPIAEDPVATVATTIPTTTKPQGNYTCMIPFLQKSEFESAVAPSRNVISPNLSVCNTRCLTTDACVASEYRQDTGQCKSYNLVPGLLFKNSCSTYPVKVYIKLILPLSVECTPLELYTALYDPEPRTLTNSQKYLVRVFDNKNYQIASS